MLTVRWKAAVASSIIPNIILYDNARLCTIFFRKWFNFCNIILWASLSWFRLYIYVQKFSIKSVYKTTLKSK